jgi:UDP-2,4-diacetamido-2,4,6-trideoxy-beta-L-altropyranose hydrolase
MIIFFCSASSSIGLGHLNRCLTLAQALHSLGERSIMVGPSKKFLQKSGEQVFSHWIEQSAVWESSFKAAKILTEIANQYSSNMVVLDDYRVDEEYQKSLTESKIHYLLFDNGRRNAIYSDIVLNTNPAIKKEDYKGKILNPEAKLLLGPKYSIIRLEFPPVFSISKRTTKRVLITFGGGDDRGAILFTLKALSKQCADNIEFVVVSGSGNPNNISISKWIDSSELNNIQLKVNPDSVAQIFASCDFAIMAGGMTVYEVSSIGLPMILIAIADNQIQHSNDWSQTTQTIEFLGSLKNLKTIELVGAFHKLISKQATLYNKSKMVLVDGLGRNRVALEVVKIRKKYESNISIKST